MADSWPPTRYTPPLSETFPSDADWLLPLVDLAWRLPNGQPVRLDLWQRHLIRHLLELFPEGHPRAGQPRWRTAVISVSRQNGKSLIGGIIALYLLVREAGALVVGVASSADQARIIQHRTLTALRSHPSLAKRFKRLTDSRGIESTDGSRYIVVASKSAAAQGLDASALVDEAHLVKPELWSDLVNGAAAKPNAIVAAVTTAGDDASTLLLDLYSQGEAAILDPESRMGFWVWEAPEARLPDDDAELREYILASTPAAAEGRLDLDTLVSDLRGMPADHAIRFRLNRFVSGRADSWLPGEFFRRAARGGVPADHGEVVFSIEVSDEFGSITATTRQQGDDGEPVYASEMLGTLDRPTPNALAALAVDLHERHAGSFITTNKLIGAALVARSLPTFVANRAEVAAYAQRAFALFATDRVSHANDRDLAQQMPAARRRGNAEGWTISRDSVEVDAVFGLVLGIGHAESQREKALQIF